MNEKDLITIQQFCVHYNIPITFIDSLNEYELIEVIALENAKYISVTQIKDIEKMIRLHFDLEINIEGVHAISSLLRQVESLQDEVKKLNNKLSFYEDQ